MAARTGHLVGLSCGVRGTALLMLRLGLLARINAVSVGQQAEWLPEQAGLG